jgi:hypothetical protein
MLGCRGGMTSVTSGCLVLDRDRIITNGKKKDE